MKQLRADFRYGLRMMMKSKLFSIIAVLTLGIGIGANSAIFSVVYGVLLRPLPFKNPERLMYIWHTPPQTSFPGMKTFSVSPANYLDWKDQSHSFEQMAVSGFKGLNPTGIGEPQALRGQAVSPEYFSVLGVAPMLGRSFAPDEDQSGRDHVVILSYGLWKSHFGADRGIVGRTINLDESPYTVIGVMPSNFRFPEYAEFWSPLSWTPATRAVRGAHDLSVIARLKPGVDLHTAQAEMNTISRRLEQEYPVDDKGWGAIVVPLREDMVGDVRPALLVLLGAVLLVLLIACANVANLMLAKILDRRTEIAVRSALGASRSRILQQVLSEAVLLAVFGGVLGTLLAIFGVSAIVGYLSDQLPRAREISLDQWVLGFTLLISVATGLITGVVPAWRLSNVNVGEALKHGGRGADTGGKHTRSILVVAEVALSLILLVGAGLLMRTLWKLQSVDPGFNPHNVLTASLSLADKKFSTPQQTSLFYEQVRQQVKAVPGVTSAALVTSLPFSGGSIQPVGLEGHPVVAMADQPEVPVRLISADYFRSMGIAILQGREFTDNDTSERPRVAVISEAMAKRFWPGERAIGKHVSLTFSQGGPREIVGVVDNVKLRGLDVQEDLPTLYSPVSQLDYPDPKFDEFRSPSLSLVVRTSLAPKNVATAVTNAVHKVDAGTPVLDVLTMEELMASSLAPQRFNMFLLGTFAAVALLLATIGIYSVLAYSVQRRTPEIGIRIALGAQVSHVLRLVLGEGMGLVLAGVAFGVVGALALSRFLRSLLYGVGSDDIATLLCVAALLSIVALGACYLPARRAMRIDPVVALRDE
ncbi:MAG: ABC transporter permease [Acidobacteriota bacterium]